jgi:hypothetical protein
MRAQLAYLRILLSLQNRGLHSSVEYFSDNLSSGKRNGGGAKIKYFQRVKQKQIAPVAGGLALVVKYSCSAVSIHASLMGEATFAE